MVSKGIIVEIPFQDLQKDNFVKFVSFYTLSLTCFPAGFVSI